MYKSFTFGLLAFAICLLSVESAQAFGGRRRAAQSYADPAPVAAASTAPVSAATTPNYAPTTSYPAQTPAYQQQYRPYPYQAGPRTQGPSYAYPNSDPRRFNFQYNH